MAKSDKKKIFLATKPKKAVVKKVTAKKVVVKKPVVRIEGPASSADVLNRLWQVVTDRRASDVTISHSARLLSRGTSKVAQKFGEEAVECLIEAVAGNKDSLVAESADVLYHLIVLWVSCGVAPQEVWAELVRREGVSGIAEKASRSSIASAMNEAGTRKIP